MKDAVDSAHVTLCIFMIRKTAEKEGARISSVRLYFTSNAFLFYFSIRLFKELTIPLQGLGLFVDAAKAVGQHGGQQQIDDTNAISADRVHHADQKIRNAEHRQ